MMRENVEDDIEREEETTRPQHYDYCKRLHNNDVCVYLMMIWCQGRRNGLQISKSPKSEINLERERERERESRDFQKDIYIHIYIQLLYIHT